MTADTREFDRRIVIEKSAPATDERGNELHTWAEYYRCAAGVNFLTDIVQTEERRPDFNTVAEFKVRYCERAAAVVPEVYRVRYGGAVYGVLSVNDVSGAHQIIKIRGVIDSGKAL